MITIEVYNVRSRIVGSLNSSILFEINGKLSYELPGAFFAQQYSKWAGHKYLFNKNTMTFPTGLIHYVEEILNKHGLSYQLIDKREPVTLGAELPVHGFKLRAYQEEASTLAVQRQRGIIKIGTGGGKTNVLISIVSKLNVPTLILIHKTDIFYQLIRRLESALKIPIGKVGDGQCDIKPITVGMIQTIARVYEKSKAHYDGEKKDEEVLLNKADQIKEYVESVKAVLTDEAHHTPSDSFWTVHRSAKEAFYKIGFSASPWREDNADLLIEAAHARQIVDVSASTLIEQNFLVKPVIFLYNYIHARKQRTEAYAALYDNEIVNNFDRNKIIAEVALKAAASGKSVLIAVTKIEHGRQLESMLQPIEPSAIFVCGEADSQLRQQVLDELDTHKRKIVICTTIFGEGIDCPGLDVLINAKAAASSVDAFQLIGRVLRQAVNKQVAYVIDIYDQSCKYLGRHSTSRLRIYQTEKHYQLIKCTNVNQINFDK